ncbi:MAG: SAM-dependent methyltransferase [Methylotenera sp.]|nr:MAG: SAM-dependent methyltransferase [Methylotenera sp.]
MPEQPLTNKTKALLALLKSLKTLQYDFKTISPLSHLRVNTRQDHPRARPDTFSNPVTKLQNLRDIFGWSRSFTEAQIDPLIFNLMQQAKILRREKNDIYSILRVSTYCYPPVQAIESVDRPDKLKAPNNHIEETLFFLHSAYPTTTQDSVFFGPDTYRYLNLIKQVISKRDQTTSKRMVDIGCGAGPGAILMAMHFPCAEVIATDINKTALELTQVNAIFAGAHHVQVMYSDILNDVDGQFDVITANPPFLVDKEQRAYRHGGGALGAELSFKMLQAAVPRLAPGGQFILYTGVAISDGQDIFKQYVIAYLNSLQSLPLTGQALTWEYMELDPDIFGEELFNDVYATSDRIAAISLIVTLSA